MEAGVGRARAAGVREERLTGGPPLSGTARAHELRARAGWWERGGVLRELGCGAVRVKDWVDWAAAKG